MEIKEPSPAYQKKHYSIREYLDMENEALEKHEYYKGEIFAMSGAGNRHNIISVNIIASLYNSLKGKSCQPYGSDMRIHIPQLKEFAKQKDQLILESVGITLLLADVYDRCKL